MPLTAIPAIAARVTPSISLSSGLWRQIKAEMISQDGMATRFLAWHFCDD
jgi:hypothetical protein